VVVSVRTREKPAWLKLVHPQLPTNRERNIAAKPLCLDLFPL
jgi:hypothetical protein